MIFRVRKEKHHFFKGLDGFCCSRVYFCRKSDKIYFDTNDEINYSGNSSDIVNGFCLGTNVALKYRMAGSIEFRPAFGSNNPVSRLIIETERFAQRQGLMREAMDCIFNHFYENDILKFDNGNEVELKSEVKLVNCASQKFHEDFCFEKRDESPSDRQDYKMTKEIFNNPEKKENRERKIQERIDVERNTKIDEERKNNKNFKIVSQDLKIGSTKIV